jgi:hypothetical protein
MHGLVGIFLFAFRRFLFKRREENNLLSSWCLHFFSRRAYAVFVLFLSWASDREASWRSLEQFFVRAVVTVTGGCFVELAWLFFLFRVGLSQLQCQNYAIGAHAGGFSCSC